MQKELFDNKDFQKGHLTDLADAKFLIKKGFEPLRLLNFYEVNDNVLSYILAISSLKEIRRN